MPDRRPDDIGSLLRSARERQGLTLRQLSGRTKIAVTVLQALERNDAQAVPEGIFGRAFVRSYAREVGLDPDRTLALFLQTFPQHRVREPSRLRASLETRGPREHHRRMVIVVAVTVLFGVSVALAAFVVGSRDGLGWATGSVRRPAALQVSGGPRAVDPETTRPLTVEIHPTGDCYVSVTVDGERVLSRLVRAGERETYEVLDRVVMEVDNAGAFAFSVNRQRGRPIGRTGEAVTLVIDRDNYRRYVSR